MGLTNKKLSFDTSIEYYNYSDELFFKDTFEIIDVKEYHDSKYCDDTVMITVKPENRPFVISELFTVKDGGKLSLLLKCIYKRRKYVNIVLSDLVGKAFKKVAVKKKNGYFCIFPEVLNPEDLETDEWKEI